MLVIALLVGVVSSGGYVRAEEAADSVGDSNEDVSIVLSTKEGTTIYDVPEGKLTDITFVVTITSKSKLGNGNYEKYGPRDDDGTFCSDRAAPLLRCAF